MKISKDEEGRIVLDGEGNTGIFIKEGYPPITIEGDFTFVIKNFTTYFNEELPKIGCRSKYRKIVDAFKEIFK